MLSTVPLRTVLAGEWKKVDKVAGRLGALVANGEQFCVAVLSGGHRVEEVVVDWGLRRGQGDRMWVERSAEARKRWRFK